MWVLRALLLSALALHCGAQLPKLYEYYTINGVSEGLKAENGVFTLNSLPITLYSGSMHYYRVHPAYWRDRLRKLRAGGLNAIETYVPWNLHEPQRGVFDFGDGGNDFSALLDVRMFLQIAQEEDLFVIFRPGPYVCGEFDFGGLPSWLLRYPDIKVRTSDTIFMEHMQQFFQQLMAQVNDLQFTRGGSIIAVQIENEYGAFGTPDSSRDLVYLDAIRASYQDNGVEELLFTCDTPANSSDIGALPGYLQMANFNTDPEVQFDLLLELQPGKPLMAMEYWSGWYDHWFEPHNTGNSPQDFARYLEGIFSYNASVNFYMYHGGSAFGFLNGANVFKDFPYYLPDISSYDYDAPLSEAGDYTQKYDLAKQLIAANNPVPTWLPEQPSLAVKTAYPVITVTEFLTYAQIIEQVPAEMQVQVSAVTSMENLDINDNNGQSFGLVVYRQSDIQLLAASEIHIGGHVRDIALVLVDGEQLTTPPSDMASLDAFGFWPAQNASMTLRDVKPGPHQLDIVVDNLGRNNFGYPADYDARKGLFEGPVSVDGVELSDFTVIPLELRASWVQSLTGWSAFSADEMKGPLMLRATLTISGEPTDTFLDMSTWTKGSIFINGFSLGRYFNVGPQLTNYVPAPLLRSGDNQIIIFEHYVAASQLVFTDAPILG